MQIIAFYAENKLDTLFLQQAILEKRCELFSFLLFSQMILRCFKPCTSELSQIKNAKKDKLKTIRFVQGHTQSLNKKQFPRTKAYPPITLILMYCREFRDDISTNI